MIVDHNGDCVVFTFNDGHGERVRVVRADERVRISSELLLEIVSGHSGWVSFGEGVMQFGTEGEGLGVVTYEIDDPRFLKWARGAVELEWLTMRRRFSP